MFVKRLVIIILVVMALALPQVAQAHGRFGPGGICIAGILGFLLGGAVASHPPVVPPPYPYYVPPSQCLREIPEHWETRWDSYYNAYVREFVHRHYIRIPCQ